jgi:hypothetical protein
LTLEIEIKDVNKAIIKQKTELRIGIQYCIHPSNAFMGIEEGKIKIAEKTSH